MIARLRIVLRVPVIVAALALSVSRSHATAADAPFAFDATPGRLPKTVIPLDYALTIVPHPATLTLSGTERVTLDVRRATSTLVFNALNLRFSAARVDGRPVVSIGPDNLEQRTTLRLRRPLGTGIHTLDLAYTGRLETAGQGMFRQTFLAPHGKTGMLVSTQFESTDARRMFACWDEPAFRATYALRITIPATWDAVSNMPAVSRTIRGATATIAFGRTPKMASYLLEVTAGDIARLRGVDSHGTAHEVWAVRGQQPQGAYALQNSEHILADYDDYFGYGFPLPRLASIAIPGGFDGAMENWGAITYNDQILLLGPAGTLEQRQDIYATQAHEMAHQWFGDLVTMGWWDNLWLNESFASWMAAKQTDRAHPEWHWWQNQDADKESAMNADARVTTHPIQQPVTDDTDAEAAFDSEITYAKGQAFLRMLEAYLGPDTFRAGIRAYIRARAFSNATSADLWNALARSSGKPVAQLANAWIFEPGFPLVTVTATCDHAGGRSVTLRQRRFLLDGTDAAAASWTIPVGIASGSGAPQYTVLRERTRAGIAAGRCDEPLRANAGDIGFYRVAYDDATFATNRRAFATLPDDDKIALLDDEWALVGAGDARLDAYLSLVPALGRNLNPRAWQQIAGALDAIDRDERGTPGQTSFEGYARSVLAPLALRLGYDEHHDDSPTLAQLRHTIVRDLGAWDDPRVIDWARLQFARVRANRYSVPAGDEAVALRIVGAHADAPTFAELEALARSARDETEFRQFSAGLGAVRDNALAARTLAFAMSADIPAQAQSERLDLIYSVAREHPALSYRFLKANADRLFKVNSVADSVFIAQEIPEVYWDAAPLDQIVAWVRAHTPREAAPELARGLERARFHLVSRDRLDSQANVIVREPLAAGARGS